jgi:hypothetical protein
MYGTVPYVSTAFFHVHRYKGMRTGVLANKMHLSVLNLLRR